MKAPQTPEQQAAERAFLERAMAMVRAQLYPGVSDSVFAREWQDLLMAVSEPAAFLHRDGLHGTAAMYLAILRTVLAAIVAEGKVGQSRYRPMYLRQCLQMHMRIKGEQYRDAAKALADRTAGKVAADLLNKLRVIPGDPAAERLTDALVVARGLLTPPRRTPPRK